MSSKLFFWLSGVAILVGLAMGGLGYYFSESNKFSSSKIAVFLLKFLMVIGIIICIAGGLGMIISSES